MPELTISSVGITAVVQPGDTIVTFTQRHLGDGNRWAEVVENNRLDYPYLVDDPAPYRAQGLRVVGWGETLKVPLPFSRTMRPEDVYGWDIAWQRPTLSLGETGDLLVPPPESATALTVETGLNKLMGRLYRLIATYPGQLPGWPDWGCRIRDYLAYVVDDWSISLGAAELKRALLSDPDVVSVDVTGEYDGKAVRYDVRLEPIPPSEILTFTVSLNL